MFRKLIYRLFTSGDDAKMIFTLENMKKSLACEGKSLPKDIEQVLAELKERHRRFGK